MKQEYLLGWGCPIVVRQALVEALNNDFTLAKIHLDRMGYPPHIGTPKLIEQMKVLAERQSGHKPKHLFITCGATGAVNAALYALKTHRTDFVVTGKRYYPLYPSMVAASDMVLMDREKRDHMTEHQGLLRRNYISLTDSPSNPDGLVYPFDPVDIWDAAYATRTYSSGGHTPTLYRVMCGSLAKTLGLSGLRLGWASTDDDEVANSMSKFITSSYAGLSVASMNIAEAILDELNLDVFESKASGYIDQNREEIQKILTKFGQGSAPTRGMFAVLELGKIERKALEKANVKWQPGNSWGEGDNWARLSLGQTREVTRAAVKAVLK